MPDNSIYIYIYIKYKLKKRKKKVPHYRSLICKPSRTDDVIRTRPAISQIILSPPLIVRSLR